MDSFSALVKHSATDKLWRFLLLALALMPILFLVQPALAQQRETDMALRLVPNRSGAIEVEAGKDTPLFLEVNNLGTNVLTDIKLSSDKGGGWVIDFKPSVISSLNPKSLQTVNVNIRPPANVTRGNQSLNIIAEAKEIRKVENFTVTVKVAALTLKLLSADRVPFPTEARAGQDNAFLLEIDNVGDKVITGIRFSSDKTEGWIISFEPSQIDSLDPGSSRTVSVTIKPPSQATKEGTEINFIAEANETRQVQPFFVTVKPAQVWIWVWLVAGVVVVAGFVLVYLRMNKQ